MTENCYVQTNGSITLQYRGIPCTPDPPGGAATCCDVGHYCLSNGFCAYTGFLSTDNLSGYYLGGCTDSTYSKRGCRTECSMYKKYDSVWDYKGNDSYNWACCGTVNGRVDCRPPQGPVFSNDAPDPLQLVPVAYINGQSSAVPYSLSSTMVPGTVTATVTASAAAGMKTASIPNEGSTSDSMAATVTLSIILGLSCLITGAVYLCLTRRLKRWQQQQQQQQEQEHTETQKTDVATPRHHILYRQYLPHQFHETDPSRQIHQLEADERAELPH